jgi:hypothetical protein
MHRLRPQAVAVLALLLLPAPAVAQQDDQVFVDPDSPTGKQYAIPLESARRQADPNGDGRLAPPGGRPAGVAPAPLFGEGIATAANADGANKPSKQKRSTASSKLKSKQRSQADSGPLKAAINNPGAPAGGIGSTALIAAGAALVLLLGGLLGFALRRRAS